MKRLFVIALAAMLAISSTISFAPLRAQVGTPPRGFSPEQERALRELAPKLSQFDVDENAVPSWLLGDLGPAVGDPHRAAMEAIRRLAPAFRMTADDSFEVRKTVEAEDEEGQTHVRLRQRYRNLPVVGSELVVHLAGEKVVGVNGRFIPDINVGNTPALNAETALATARRSLAAREIKELSAPELLVFVIDWQTPRLAWSQTVLYVGTDGKLQDDAIFADAQTGQLLGRHAQLHSAKFRKIYTANNTFQTPGTLLWQEGQSLPNLDQAATGARNGTGKTYDFYKNIFNRDSYDGAGAAMVSSVHYGVEENNAYWSNTKKQMLYGDGDGVLLGLTSTSLDVTAHELTHGVTGDEVGLPYQDETGAINEALSDIMGESVDYFYSGSTDWKLGEDIWKPGVAGDALRYMNDPILDYDNFTWIDPEYYSRDYYPDRYTGFGDYGGVHFNSGIANLAFHLMSVGGTHPQNKTNVVVPAIGIEQAWQIWYKALRSYMTPATDFADARKTTVQAAQSLFSCKAINPAIVDAVKKAWDAVGVPDTSQNGWAMLGISGPVYSDTSPCVYVSPNYNLFLNPSFEKGSVVWVAGRGVITNSASQPAYGLGSWKAWLCGQGFAQTDTAYQQVTIPSVATTATLSFALHIDTAETSTTTAYDTLDVQLRDSSNNVLTTLATYSNLNKNNGYALKTLDMTAYKGLTLRVYFKGTENSTKQTSFVIDGTALNVK